MDANRIDFSLSLSLCAVLHATRYSPMWCNNRRGRGAVSKVILAVILTFARVNPRREEFSYDSDKNFGPLV